MKVPYCPKCENQMVQRGVFIRQCYKCGHRENVPKEEGGRL